MAIKSPRIKEFQLIVSNYDKDREDLIWKADGQPEIHLFGSVYTDLAKNSLQVPSAAKVVDLLIEAEYVTHEERGNTIYKILTLKPKEKLELDGVSIQRRIKQDSSIAYKMQEDGKKPKDIGDYDAYRLSGKTRKDVIRLNIAVASSPSMTSQKNEFIYPSDKGFRSLKTHQRIEGNGHAMSIEVMVTHAGFDKIEQETHRIIDKVRHVTEKQFAEASNAVSIRNSYAYAACNVTYDNFRAAHNFNTAAKLGLNDFCAPNAKTEFAPKRIPGRVNNWARKIAEKLAPGLVDTESLVVANANYMSRREIA